ncbi:hypothetical protein CVT26_003576 [Gymnopilus dilepis]|uniref:Uncharacterized protein n=1 Tax=Gymnopilus dilepis TaxID=231916 RepID=A0A409VS94_9AGAR|nr:hypothetical protein CVT26_003576 [Gymnopilus dilepis]
MESGIPNTHEGQLKLEEGPITLEAAPIVLVDYRPGEARASALTFLYKRATYYWITLFLNLCQVGFCAAGMTLAIVHDEFSYKDKKRGYSGDAFVVAGLYSIFLFFFNAPTLYFQYKKGSDTGAKSLNAGKHFSMTICAAMINFLVMYMLLILGPAFTSKVAPCADNVRPVLYWLVIAFCVVGGFCNVMAARVIIKAAKQARAQYTTASLLLLSMENGVSPARGGQSKPKPDEGPIALEAAPVVFVDYRPAGEVQASALDFLYKRATYYWIALFLDLCQLGFCAAGITLAIIHDEFWYKDKKRGYSGGAFVIAGLFSIMPFFFNVTTLYFQYKKGNDVGPKAFNAGKHFSMTICAAMNDFFIVYMLLILGPAFGFKVAPCGDNVRPVLFWLIIAFCVVGGLCNVIAAHIIIKAAKQARGSEMVPDPNHRVPAWQLATTEEASALGGSIRL